MTISNPNRNLRLIRNGQRKVQRKLNTPPAPDKEAFPSGSVNLVCSKCTRTQTFGVAGGDDGLEATKIAIAKTGWARINDRTICPNCPK